MTGSVTLDALDRRLIHALQIDGRASFSRIATVLGVPERTVARRYHRLRSALVVRVVGLVDSQRIGMLDWFVRIDCAPDAVDALTAALAQRDDTSWIAPLAGGTRLTCMVRTPGAQSAGGRPLFDHLLRTPGMRDVEAACVLRPVAGVGGWSGRTSALDASEQAALRGPAPGSPDGPEDLAEMSGWGGAEARLAGELALDGRADVARLAAVTGWSDSTVRRRVAGLRAAGVLHFEVDVSPSHFGFPLEALLWLEVAPAALGEVTEAMSRHASVAFAAVTTGRASVFAMVQSRDPGALYDYLAGELAALPGIGRVETALVQRRAKRAGPLLPPTTGAERARRFPPRPAGSRSGPVR
ncbi:Lrp/AsnC family transcriptional regulator [Streptomyces sp. Je 1-79]|uniref:Lrp/AsnC family transcriptional regulator n=1 Tax=Streptomyces sp. Je 1-79 TaxID=2943847 RepID=UPI0021A79558|nr:Lrp/AsnC family transcriptional regulator [Streptomyces sp. Je 1-79]MCT4351848.1 Lrp/AsnC family transcriptional regulator [Streptomyces sp. Je 1-79]